MYIPENLVAIFHKLYIPLFGKVASWAIFNIIQITLYVYNKKLYNKNNS